MGTVTGFEEWRRVALERGYRQDLGGWMMPNGVRVSAEFVRRVCSPPRSEVVAHVLDRVKRPA